MAARRVAILTPILAIVAFGASLPNVANTVSLGDNAYRTANFEQAESFYRQALSLDPKCARALLGLGRIEELRFERAAARDHFAAAYRLDPNDPEIIRSYSAFATPDRQAELLTNYIASGGENRGELEAALGHLQMKQRLGVREIGALESPYQSYSLPLRTYFAASRPAGMVLEVRVNDSKPLRLIVDTGAEGIVIRRKIADKLGLENLGVKQFRGFGGGVSSDGRTALARSLSIGDLRLKNCLVDVIESLPTVDADGVIGPAVLQRFLIRFDPGRNRLELSPFGEEMDFSPERPWWDVNRSIPAGMERYTKVLKLGHFLLAPARVDGGFGYFLLDTGAAYSVIPPQGLEAALNTPMYGADGRMDAAVRPQPVQFHLTGASLTDRHVIASDLSKLSARAGIKISGVIGYPALSQTVLTVNYRDGLIDLGR